MDRLRDSPCTTFCVLAAKSCCSRTTQLRCSSPGQSSGRLAAVFVLRLNVPHVFALIPQFTILHSKKERALCDSVFFEVKIISPEKRWYLCRALPVGLTVTWKLRDGRTAEGRTRLRADAGARSFRPRGSARTTCDCTPGIPLGQRFFVVLGQSTGRSTGNHDNCH